MCIRDRYASDIETILNAEHDAIMTMSETVDEGIQNMNDQVGAANCIICTMVAHLCRIVLDYKKRKHKPGECYEKLTKYCLYYC